MAPCETWGAAAETGGGSAGTGAGTGSGTITRVIPRTRRGSITKFHTSATMASRTSSPWAPSDSAVG